MPRLRELSFRLGKTVKWYNDSLTWVDIASLYLRALGPLAHHRLDKVIITWPRMLQLGNNGIGMLQEDTKLRDFEALLDILPALSSATMVLTCQVHGATEVSEYVRRLRDMWKHPRSSVECKVTASFPSDFKQNS